MNLLILTARFLDNRYHGLLTKNGPPEWPPSPYRLFQALVSGVARRGELVEGDDVVDNKNLAPIGRALDWLQKHTSIHPPLIIAPRAKAYQEGDGVIRFVPNNDDETHFHPELHRVAKPTIPTLFLLDSDQKPEVHYVWHLDENHDCPKDHIERAARSLTALGWGIDMAFADARLASEDELGKIKGVRWYPNRNAGSFHNTLRTPTYDDEACTLRDLRRCHNSFVSRIEHGKALKTVDKPKVFDRVLYTSVERPIARPCVVFKLVDENDDAFRYPHAKLIHIAGMVRHLAIREMEANKGCRQWITADWVNRVVRGKRDESAGDNHKQFSYVPLPSIGVTHADALIRNVMIVAPLGMERELHYLAERLDGLSLEPEGDAEKCFTDSSPNLSRRVELQRFTPPQGKFISNCYLGTSSVWETVTPVILDGCTRQGKSDKLEAIARATERLICKALNHAGIEAPCEFTWQSLPFFKNALSAHKYDTQGRRPVYFRPAYLKGFNAVHLRIRFGQRAASGDPNSAWLPTDVPGPITIGAGRHCGFGLFAATKER